MAPPSSRPKLSDIDPAALAGSVRSAFREHSANQAAAHARLADTIEALHAYAASGETLGKLDVSEYVQRLAHLWESCCGPEWLSLDKDVDSTSDLGAVILAALARDSIESRKPVTAVRLAALAGKHPRHINLLCREGRLATNKAGLISAASARSWLAELGVPGFGSKR